MILSTVDGYLTERIPCGFSYNEAPRFRTVGARVSKVMSQIVLFLKQWHQNIPALLSTLGLISAYCTHTGNVEGVKKEERRKRCEVGEKCMQVRGKTRCSLALLPNDHVPKPD